MRIGSRQRESYQQEGYAVVRRLISGDELREFDRMTDRLLDGDLQPELGYRGWKPDHFYTFWEPGMEDRTDLPRRDRVRLMANMYHHHPYFRAIGSHPAIYDVVASIYETGVRMFSDTVFVKPAYHGIEAALHQDTAFWPKTRPNAMNFWLAIDAATVENGCLQVIPESHTVDVPHHDHPVQGHILHDHEVDIDRQIPIELEAGDGIFFDSALMHRSYPNQSDRRRRAYAAVYGPEDIEHLEPWNLSPIAEKVPDYQFELIEPPGDANC